MSINSKGILKKKSYKHFKLKYAVNKVQTTYDMISSLNAWFSFQEGRPLDYWHFSSVAHDSEQPIRYLYIHNEDSTLGNAMDTIFKP